MLQLLLYQFRLLSCKHGAEHSNTSRLPLGHVEDALLAWWYIIVEFGYCLCIYNALTITAEKRLSSSLDNYFSIKPAIPVTYRAYNGCTLGKLQAYCGYTIGILWEHWLDIAGVYYGQTVGSDILGQYVSMSTTGTCPFLEVAAKLTNRRKKNDWERDRYTERKNQRPVSSE